MVQQASSGSFDSAPMILVGDKPQRRSAQDDRVYKVLVTICILDGSAETKKSQALRMTGRIEHGDSRGRPYDLYHITGPTSFRRNHFRKAQNCFALLDRTFARQRKPSSFSRVHSPGLF